MVADNCVERHSLRRKDPSLQLDKTETDCWHRTPLFLKDVTSANDEIKISVTTDVNMIGRLQPLLDLHEKSIWSKQQARWDGYRFKDGIHDSFYKIMMSWPSYKLSWTFVKEKKRRRRELAWNLNWRHTSGSQCRYTWKDRKKAMKGFREGRTLYSALKYTVRQWLTDPNHILWWLDSKMKKYSCVCCSKLYLQIKSTDGSRLGS